MSRLRPLSDGQKRAQHNWVALEKEMIRRYGVEPILKWIFLEWVGWVDPDTIDRGEKTAYLEVEAAIGEEATYADE